MDLVTLKHMHPDTLLDHYEELIIRLEQLTHVRVEDETEIQEIVGELKSMRNYIWDKL